MNGMSSLPRNDYHTQTGILQTDSLHNHFYTSCINYSLQFDILTKLSVLT